MAPRWNEDTTIKFLELYIDRPNLWDQFSELYKDKSVRELAMSEIVSAMDLEGFGIPEAKAKIKALRATYIGEISKQERCAKSGVVYVPSLKWIHIMKYIMEKGTLRAQRETMLVSIVMFIYVFLLQYLEIDE